MPNLSFRPSRAVKTGLKTTACAVAADMALEVAPVLLPFPFNIIARAVLSGVVRMVGNTAKHKYGAKVPF